MDPFRDDQGTSKGKVSSADSRLRIEFDCTESLVNSPRYLVYLVHPRHAPLRPGTRTFNPRSGERFFRRLLILAPEAPTNPLLRICVPGIFISVGL
jgi:hypothetical protein